jgi:hypothetical protein
MGDNRNDSQDSHFQDGGLVPALAVLQADSNTRSALSFKVAASDASSSSSAGFAPAAGASAGGAGLPRPVDLLQGDFPTLSISSYSRSGRGALNLLPRTK